MATKVDGVVQGTGSDIESNENSPLMTDAKSSTRNSPAGPVNPPADPKPGRIKNMLLSLEQKIANCTINFKKKSPEVWYDFLDKVAEPCLAIIGEFLLVVFSFITGQLFHFSYLKNIRDSTPCKIIYSFILCLFVILLLIVNTVPVGFVLYSWIGDSIDVFNATFLFNVEKVNKTTNKFPSIVLRDMSTDSIDAHSLSDQHVIDNLNEFEPYAKLVITLFTISSALSFVLFIVALLCTYNCVWLRKCITRHQDIEHGVGANRDEGNKSAEVKPLDSFRYDDKNKTSTKLYLPESLYFSFLFVSNVLLLIGCIAVFGAEHYNKASYYNISHVDIRVEATVVGAYMYSLLCTLVSCFIFSKLAYSVTRRCLDLYNKLQIYPGDGTPPPGDGTQPPGNGTQPPGNDTTPPGEGTQLPNNALVGTSAAGCSGDGILKHLIDEDDNFTKMAQATLNMFEYWFTVHWVCYTVTSFLSVALFFDMLTKHIQSQFNKPPDTAIGFSQVELVVVALFTVQHCFLFLYPCFKAAAVTVGREKLIKKVNAYQDPKLNPQNKQFLIQYLKNKKFGFRISFFCARLRFGFNVAYISIFIGLLGVLLKLTGVF